MGYHVSIGVDIVIPARHIDACLAAINALEDGAWVAGAPVGGYPTLVDAFTAWRYDAHVTNNGSVHVSGFNGEKWGDDETLYKAIAPFVTDDGTVHVDGEDGEFWKYEFNDSEVLIYDGIQSYGPARELP